MSKTKSDQIEKSLFVYIHNKKDFILFTKTKLS